MEPRGVYCQKKEIDNDNTSEKSKTEKCTLLLKTWSSLLTHITNTTPLWGSTLLWSSFHCPHFILATPFCGHTSWFVTTCYCVTPEMINSVNTLWLETSLLPSHALKCFQCTKLFDIKPFYKLTPFLSIHTPFHSTVQHSPKNLELLRPRKRGTFWRHWSCDNVPLLVNQWKC